MKHHVIGAHHTSHEAQAGHIEAKDARSVGVARFIPIGWPVYFAKRMKWEQSHQWRQGWVCVSLLGLVNLNWRPLASQSKWQAWWARAFSTGHLDQLTVYNLRLSTRYKRATAKTISRIFSKRTTRMATKRPQPSLFVYVSNLMEATPTDRVRPQSVPPGRGTSRCHSQFGWIRRMGDVERTDQRSTFFFRSFPGAATEGTICQSLATRPKLAGIFSGQRLMSKTSTVS